jgi:hypothetical protein
MRNFGLFEGCGLDGHRCARGRQKATGPSVSVGCLTIGIRAAHFLFFAVRPGNARASVENTRPRNQVRVDFNALRLPFRAAPECQSDTLVFVRKQPEEFSAKTESDTERSLFSEMLARQIVDRLKPCQFKLNRNS